MLYDIADGAAKFHLVPVHDVHTIDAYRTLVNIGQAVYCPESGGFSAAGGTNNCDEFSVRNGEIQILQDLLFAVILGNVIKFYHFINSFLPVKK